MTLGELLPWLSTAFMAGWAIYLKGHSNRVRVTDQHATEIASMKQQIDDLRLAQARTESPMLKQVQDLLSAGLHHPDPSHVRQDRLLEKLDQTTLTPAEVPELKAILTAQIANPKTPPNEAEAAKALIAIMPLVVKETAAVANVTTVAIKESTP